MLSLLFFEMLTIFNSYFMSNLSNFNWIKLYVRIGISNIVRDL